MQTIRNEYIRTFNDYIAAYVPIKQKLNDALLVIKNSNRLFFIGNGGSQSLCSHLTEDFIKTGKKISFSLEGSSYISCLANDLGWENIYVEWLKQYGFNTYNDCLIAISSSGNSKNILNAINYVKHNEKVVAQRVIGLSAHCGQNVSEFYPNYMSNLNLLIHFYVDTKSYGIAENLHSIILHILLDMYVEQM